MLPFSYKCDAIGNFTGVFETNGKYLSAVFKKMLVLSLLKGENNYAKGLLFLVFIKSKDDINNTANELFRRECFIGHYTKISEDNISDHTTAWSYHRNIFKHNEAVNLTIAFVDISNSPLEDDLYSKESFEFIVKEYLNTSSFFIENSTCGIKDLDNKPVLFRNILLFYYEVFKKSISTAQNELFYLRSLNDEKRIFIENRKKNGHTYQAVLSTNSGSLNRYWVEVYITDNPAENSRYLSYKNEKSTDIILSIDDKEFYSSMLLKSDYSVGYDELILAVFINKEYLYDKDSDLSDIYKQFIGKIPKIISSAIDKEYSDINMYDGFKAWFSYMIANKSFQGILYCECL